MSKSYLHVLAVTCMCMSIAFNATGQKTVYGYTMLPATSPAMVSFTTDDGILYIDCHYSDIRNNAPESIELRRDHKLVKKTDVTGFTWQEKAKALSEMMA